MVLRVFASAASARHTAPPGHVERPERLGAAIRGVALAGHAELGEARAATREELLRAHAGEMVATVELACAASAWLDADTFVTPGSWDAALNAAGAAVEAAESAARGEPAFAIVRPPGHHATRTRAMGFCLLNNVAVAAAALAARGKRVAVFDFDVHHGNGTQDVFWQDPRVLYVSIHQHPLYPGTGAVEEAGAGPGAGTTVNLPVPAGTAHDGWLEIVERVVVPVIARFAPDVLLLSAGFDAHARDPLGGLRLVAPTFHEATARLVEVCPRAAAVLEGGYDLVGLERGVAGTAAALVGAACPVEEGPPPGVAPWAGLRERVMKVHEERWGLGER